MTVEGKLLDDVYSICSECAKANGATWPDGHVATFWTQNCDVCHEEKGICDVSDWNWPKGRRPKQWTIYARD